MRHLEVAEMRQYLEVQLSRDHGYDLLTLVNQPLHRLVLMHMEAHGR